jgi:hypothetical protein
MLQIEKRQLACLADESQRQFVLATVVDWVAAFEVCHAKPPRISFEEAEKVAGYLCESLARTMAPEMQEDPTRDLIHRVLTAGEQGASAAQLRSAASAYAAALPAREAAEILFDWHCSSDFR